MLCSELHFQKGFDLIFFPNKCGCGEQRHREAKTGPAFFFFFITPSPELSDTTTYAP